MLSYDDRGEGSAVLLLHSGGMSGRQWRRLAEQLAIAHRVISPDFLGVGASPPLPEGVSFLLDVAATLEIIDTLSHPVDLVGHSYGGLVALTIARQRPELVRSLALYDPASFGLLHTEHDDEGRADLERLTDVLFANDDLVGTPAWLGAFVDYWGGPGSWAKTPVATQESLLRAGRVIAMQGRSITSDRTPASAYAAIAAPTLLLTGSLGPASVARIAVILQRTLPHASTAIIDGAGHMGPVTHPDAVNGRIAAHFARLGAAQGAQVGEMADQRARE